MDNTNETSIYFTSLQHFILFLYLCYWIWCCKALNRSFSLRCRRRLPPNRSPAGCAARPDPAPARPPWSARRWQSPGRRRSGHTARPPTAGPAPRPGCAAPPRRRGWRSRGPRNCRKPICTRFHPSPASFTGCSTVPNWIRQPGTCRMHSSRPWRWVRIRTALSGMSYAKKEPGSW